MTVLILTGTAFGQYESAYAIQGDVVIRKRSCTNHI